jgi:MFS family permease
VVAPVTARPVVDVPTVQRRTVRLLFGTQIVGGVGVAIGIAVGALLAADMVGTGLSGVAQSSAVIGGAAVALPVTRLMRSRGRRPGLALAYLIGAVGAVLVVVATATGASALLFLGMFCFGGGTAANLQARYTAVDLAEPSRRGRQLSYIVWATTIGAVAGPNLAPLAGTVVGSWGLPRLSGPFAFSALAFGVAAGALTLLLRPDPLLLARRIGGDGEAGTPNRSGADRDAGTAEVDADAGAGAGPGRDPRAAARGGTMGDAVRVAAARPAARLGITSVAIGHLVMVGVMSMTPVHIGLTHAPADTLRIVGVVLSLHIAGMYAFSPVFGLLTDRMGRRPVIMLGVGLLLAACAVAGTAGHDTVRLSAGLTLLGLGWSGTMVGGSTLLSESVPVLVRPAAQGLSDALMGLAGATGGALSGVIVQWSGYSALALLAALATVPLVALALRPVPPVLSEGV